MRYFVYFSYFGKEYHGWQRQPNAHTIQQVMEEAFGTLLRGTVALVGAGRTDSGVHAREMVAHFDWENLGDSEDLAFRLNSYLPEDIAISGIVPVPHDAHARFDAVERTYVYTIIQAKDPFYKDTAHLVYHQLDVRKMNNAAALLLKHSDFKCFSKSRTDVKTYICDVRKATWEWEGDFLRFTISADRFLRNMVRAVVGTLLDVGMGKIEVDDVKTIINSGDRSEAGVSVPAKGLSLTSIRYPEKIEQFHG